MSGLLVGLFIGALVFGGLAVKYEQARRARQDWVGAARVHRSARSAFWRALGKLVAAAVGPFLVVGTLYVLFRIGQHR